MEEVDKIIVLTLRQIGTDLPESVVSLKEAFVEGCARCINTINGNDEVPLKLPPGMSARFRHGTALANAIKALGFSQEIGYNSFLYSNENESRSLLMWLVERLPKENVSGGDESGAGPNAAFYRAVSTELTRRLRMAWVPPVAKKSGVCWRGSPPTWHLEGAHSVHGFSSVTLSPCDVAGASKARLAYIDRRQPLLSQQPPARSSVASSTTHAKQQLWDAEWNKQGLLSGLSAADYKAKKQAGIKQRMADKIRAATAKGALDRRQSTLADILATLAGSGEPSKVSSFRNKELLQFASEESAAAAAPKAVSEEELAKQRADAEEALQADVTALESRIAQLKAEIAQMAAAAQQTSQRADTISGDNAKAEASNAVRKQVTDLLPNADENIAKLQGVVDNSAQRLLTLGAKWDEARKTMTTDLRKLRLAAKSKKSDAQGQLEEIKVLREQMKVIAEEARGREAMCRQLEEAAAKLPADSNRAMYTRRILEIVRNINRQKDDISKKDISQLSEKVGRTFTVVDELVFKDAKKDEHVRKAYKLIANLHELCGTIISAVESTGATTREIRSLEDQVEGEQRKNMAARLQRVAADLKQVKADNAALG